MRIKVQVAFNVIMQISAFSFSVRSDIKIYTRKTSIQSFLKSSEDKD